MSDQAYCSCARPNTRHVAFARSNGYNCPQCNRILNPDPNSPPYQEENQGTDQPPSLIPNILPSPLPLAGNEVSLSPVDFPDPPSILSGGRGSTSPPIPVRAPVTPPPVYAAEEGAETPQQHNQEELSWLSPTDNRDPQPRPHLNA